MTECRVPVLLQPGLRFPWLRSNSPLFGLLAVVFLLFGAVWLRHLSITSSVIPMDNVEELVWVRSLEWGYFKHPPLPTWLLWPVVQIVGPSGMATMLLGAALTLASISLMAVLAFQAGGPVFALIASLATLCVTHYNSHLHYYNHNVLMMFWVALSAVIVHRLLVSGKLYWWLALGIVAGLGMLTKYQFALIGVPWVILFWHDGLWRRPAHRLGMLVAGLVSTALFAPHLFWLLHQTHGPLQYAMHSSLGARLDALHRIGETLFWSADWIIDRCLPALIVVAIAARSMRALRAARASTGDAPYSLQPDTPTDGARAARQILILWGLVPFVLMILVGLLAGSHLQRHWGTAFADWTIPAAMLLLGLDRAVAAPDRWLWRSLMLPFVLVQAALLLWSYEVSSYGQFPEPKKAWRQFPAATIAGKLAAPAHATLRGPIRVLAGDELICGAIALELPEHPKVLIAGQRDISPWVRADDLDAQATVWIWKAQDAPADSWPLPHGLRWSTHQAVPVNKTESLPSAA